MFAAGKKGGSSLYLAEPDSYDCLEGYSSANKIHVRVGEEKVYLSDGEMLEELDLSDGTGIRLYRFRGNYRVFGGWQNGSCRDR